MPARSGSARRYADALFSIARDRNRIDEWADELERLGTVVQHPDAMRFLNTPALGLRRKREAIAALADPLSRETRSLVDILLERRRVSLVPAVADAFAGLVRAHKGIELAEVTTALELSEDERRLVAQRLAARVGKNVDLRTRVDPAIIGGVVARVGDQLFDGSVRGRLQALKRRLRED